MGYGMDEGWGLLGSLADRLVGGMIASTGECGLVGPEGLNDTPMPVACYCMGACVWDPLLWAGGGRVFWAALNGL